MTESMLKATKREKTGGLASNRLRKKGKIPAVVYGKGEENLHVAIDCKAFKHLVEHGARLVQLELEGGKKEVMIKEVHYGTYDHQILHADFIVIDPEALVKVHVEVSLTGVARGSTAGGVVEQELYEVEVECKPRDIPQQIDVDISELDLGSSLLVSDMDAPANVTILTPSEDPVVACHLPHEEEEEEDEAAAPEGDATEPEVIGEKPKEDEPEE